MLTTPKTERSLNRDMRIQDAFLNHCRRERVNVMVQLLDQTKMEGQIVGFDTNSIVIDDGGNQHLLYKSAIIAINPQKLVNYIFNDSYRGESLRANSKYSTNYT